MSYTAPCPDCGQDVKWWYVASSLTNAHRTSATGMAKCKAIQALSTDETHVTSNADLRALTAMGPNKNVVTWTTAPLLTCKVPGRLPNLANSRLHHMALYRKKTDRERDVMRVALSARAVARMEPCLEPRWLRAIVHFHGRIPDLDNAVANMKADIDGLVAAGWLKADSPEWMPRVPEVGTERLPRYHSDEYTIWECRTA